MVPLTLCLPDNQHGGSKALEQDRSLHRGCCHRGGYVGEDVHVVIYVYRDVCISGMDGHERGEGVKPRKRGYTSVAIYQKEKTPGIVMSIKV